MYMSIERVNIASDQSLEGMLRRQSKKAGVVICHPHPLYGGNMYNNVVSAIEDGYSTRGYTTLIFNFRGVGNSKGEYDEGDGETRDAKAAHEFLTQNLDDDARITLAGYSFGAWVISRTALEVNNYDSIFLVSFPCLIYKTDHLRSFDKEIFIVGGVYDDIAPIDDLLDLYKKLTISRKHLKVIDTTHFYAGKEMELIDFIKETVHSHK